MNATVTEIKKRQREWQERNKQVSEGIRIVEEHLFRLIIEKTKELLKNKAIRYDRIINTT